MIVVHCCNRPGDLARIEENAGAGINKKAAKTKKLEANPAANSKCSEGVVYKVNFTIRDINHRSLMSYA